MAGRIALLLLVAVAAVSGKPSSRIIGGEEAQPSEFPYLVELQRSGAHFCSGSILNEEWIVTAAHCATGRPADYTVVAGEHNRNATEGSEQVRQVVRVVKHPLYESAEAADFENDIAVMQVLPAFELNENVKLATFPSADFMLSETATIAGWGAISEQSGSSDVLRKAMARIVSDDECNTAYGGDAVTPSMVCAGGNGTDFCTGDSGGPLLCSDSSNSDIVCGIMSWGLGCGRPGFPGVYTEASHFTEWLVDAILPEPEDNSTYVEQLEGCGGSLVGSAGKIGYQLSGEHTENERCTWSVRTNFRETIRLTLNESSGFGPGTYLEVTEIDFSSGKTTRKSRIDPDNHVIMVPGYMVFITLVSNTSNAGGDFLLLFQALGEQSSSELVLKHFHAGNGTTFSYPASGSYGNNEFNTFVINPPTGAINLRFTRLDLETGSCTYDVLNVHTHSLDGFNSIMSICGANPPSADIVSDGVVLIVMKTDSSIVATGFTVSWT